MNISINNVCNRRCDYCFQRKWYLSTSKEDEKEMSTELFGHILSKTKIPNIAIMGGEPLMHSNIEGILDLAHKFDKNICFFSNISIPHSRFVEILDYTNQIELKHSWLINCDYTDAQKSDFMANYEYILTKEYNDFSITATFVQNYDKNVQKANKLVDLYKMAKEDGLKREHLSIRTSPMTYNHSEDYNEEYDYTKDYMYFTKILYEYDKHADFHFDCKMFSLPCKIHPKYFGIMSKKENHFGSLDNYSKCSPPFDIMVDGSAVYGSCSTFIRLEPEEVFEFNNMEEVYEELQKKKNVYWSLYPMNKKCQDCFKYKYNLCPGMTCMAENNHLCEKYGQKHLKQTYEK